MKPFAEESKFWHSVWLSMGKPINCYQFEMMKKTKHAYKYAIRRLKKCNDRMKDDQFIQSALERNSCIFDELKKQRGSAKKISSRIDNAVGAKNIANHFSSIFRKLYNNVNNCSKFYNLSNEIHNECQHATSIISNL